MSAARSCCSLNALLTVACVAVVESGRDGTGRDGTGRKKKKEWGIATQAILTVVMG